MAFFIFVLGFSLARERRPAAEVLFNRVFEVYLCGVPIAIILSVAAYFAQGSFALSNYLPFLLGANVLFDNFPSNPTTWYIGTYVHVLLLWTVFMRGRPVRPWMLAVSIPVEIVVRMLLVETAGNYIAYMLASNWVSVFILGSLYGQRREPHEQRGRALPVVALAALAVGWAVVMPRMLIETGFPFSRLTLGAPGLDPLFTSACVSALYVGFAWLVFLVCRDWQPFAWVRFVARNTLIVFIAHMPVFYWLTGVLAGTGASYAVRSLVQVTVCLFGIALLSEGFWRLVQPKRLRGWVAARLFGPRATGPFQAA